MNMRTAPTDSETLFARRAEVYDAAPRVEWVDATMYDREETVDAYDTSVTTRKLSTLSSATELEFLDMIDDLGINSVLDVGCGAGAFHHLLKVARPGVGYFGFDLSAHQIARAKKLFGDCFAVRDISTIETAEFARYDAIHAYSVFSFMAAEQQLATIGRMLQSGAKILIETGVTLPHIDYAPRSCFKSFMNIDVAGRTLVTVVTFPFKRELERLVEGTDHEIVYTERTYASTRALNDTNRAGGALADMKQIRARDPAFEAVAPTPPEWKYLFAKIRPKSWVPANDYSTLDREAVETKLARIIGNQPVKRRFLTPT